MAEDTDVALAARLDRIKRLTDELVRVQDACDEAKKLAARIQREADAARAALKMPNP